MNATPVGALLLCRAEPSSVRPPAHLLREHHLLASAGDGWSVLVPEGRPWREREGGPDDATRDLTRDSAQEGAREGAREDRDVIDRVVGGWASALSVATGRPALALWWDGDRVGFTLASGFRRPVGYVWLADGTPAGEEEALHTFAARLGLDPVLDLQTLEPLTHPDSAADGRARLLGLIAVLARIGLRLPPGLAPGEPTGALWAAARTAGAETIEWAGWRDAVRVELHAVEEGLDHWLKEPRRRGERLGAAQVAMGVPVLVYGVRRGSAGWVVAGCVLLANGFLHSRR
ncbi:hypothetical protein ACFVIM_25095 [Streptomyces sp. NPDC057638]|uniref:hypothetical protein n=1 Tax=Streptomyces sp. NPDC057638 TaxID=3346190 RepID=UPI0036BA8CC1